MALVLYQELKVVLTKLMKRVVNAKKTFKAKHVPLVEMGIQDRNVKVSLKGGYDFF